jgi:hypothetical protein
MWLKGNLHAHSTVSDGHMPPEPIFKAYEERGYDFFSMTDHNIYNAYPSDGGMLLIPGFELSCFIAGKSIHVNCIQKTERSLFGNGQKFVIKDDRETMEFLEGIKDDYLLILNHPDWSLLEYPEVKGTDIFKGLEVLNWQTEWFDRMGESTHFWDSGLRDGMRWKAYATDDSHTDYPEEPGWPFHNFQNDSFGGWVMVRVKEKSQKAIIEALENGWFYATEGPEIHDFFVEGNDVTVSCSPVDRVCCKGEHYNCKRLLRPGITGCTLPLRNNKQYVRVEVIDAKGKIAWSNPIYLDKR